MAGQTSSDPFVPFGPDTQQHRPSIRSAVAAHGGGTLDASHPFAQLARLMDLPVQTAAPRQAPRPKAKPRRASEKTRGQTARQRRKTPPIETESIGPPEDSREGPSPAHREAGTGRRPELPAGAVQESAASGLKLDLPNAENAAAVASRLREEGLPEPAIAGILGNLQQESRFDPNAVGDNGNSIGIAQWNGPRARQLRQFAEQQGYGLEGPNRIPPLEAQVEFLLWEMNNTEREAAETIFSAPSPDLAAVAASRNFWRPGEPMLDNRVRFAENAAQQLELSAHMPPAEAPTGEFGSMGARGEIQGPRGFETGPAAQGLPTRDTMTPPAGIGPSPEGGGDAELEIIQRALARLNERLGPMEGPPPLGPNHMPPAQGQPQQPAPMMPPAQEPTTRANVMPPAPAPGPELGAEGGLFRQALFDFLRTGDFRAFESVPERQRPLLLQSLGAAARGQ